MKRGERALHCARAPARPTPKTDEGADIGSQVWLQFVGCAITFVYCGIISFVILKLIDVTIGLKVKPADVLPVGVPGVTVVRVDVFSQDRTDTEAEKQAASLLNVLSHEGAA